VWNRVRYPKRSTVGVSQRHLIKLWFVILANLRVEFIVICRAFLLARAYLQLTALVASGVQLTTIGSSWSVSKLMDELKLLCSRCQTDRTEPGSVS
jgi:hypothetical protein